jgi:hypothetical protein
MRSPYKTNKPDPGSSTPYITKGTRIVAQWYDAHIAGLSGVQMKFGATEIMVTGVARHFRGNDPVAPTKVDIYIEVDGPVPPGVTRERPYGCTCPGHDQLVRVSADHVRKVLPPVDGSSSA